MLNQLFKSLQSEKNRYLNAQRGNEFEERIMSYLKLDLGFNRILKEDVSIEDWGSIKKHIFNKFSSNFIGIPSSRLKKTFIYQPYGSQQFPDFIIFTNKKVVPLEAKFSTKRQSKPVWNSNVPRANAFYVFGSRGLQDLTFFCGNDIVTAEHRKSLYGFFKDMRILQDKIRGNMPTLDLTNRGFTPYIRSAFDQRKHKLAVETNFFIHPDRKKVENMAMKKAKLLS